MGTRPPSVLMFAGEDNYSLSDFIMEAEDIGISKRIPQTAIPEGLVNGVSKIFVAHAKAIVKVTAPGCTLQDLAYVLVSEGKMTQVEFAKLVDLDQPFWTGEELQPDDFVPECMLDITFAFSLLPAKRQAELTKQFDLVFCNGIFGYSPVTSLQYVLPANETELPPELAHLDGYIEGVHMKYLDDEEDADDDVD